MTGWYQLPVLGLYTFKTYFKGNKGQVKYKKYHPITD